MRSEVAWILTGRVATALIQLISIRIITGLLEPKDYAFFAVIVVIQTLATLVLISPVGNYVNRHIHEWHDTGTLSEKLHAYSRYRFLAGLAAGSSAILWFSLTRTFSNVGATVAPGLVVGFTVYSLTSLGTAVDRLNMLGFRRESVVCALCGALLSLAFSTLFTSISPTGHAWLFGQGLGALLVYIAVRRLNSASKPKKHMRLKSFFQLSDLGKFCLPLAAISSLAWLETSGYRLLIERAWTPEVFTFFILGITIPMQMGSLLEAIAMQYLYPYFLRAVAHDTDDSQKKTVVAHLAALLFPLYLLWTALLIIGSPYVVLLITDPQYHAAVQWVMFGALIEFTRLIGNAWQSVAMAQKDFLPVLPPVSVGAVGVLVATVIVVWADWPPVWFAVTLVAMNFLKVSALIYTMYRRMRFPLSIRRITCAVLVVVITLGFVSWLPLDVTPLAALIYLAATFLAISLPIAIHLWTSSSMQYLLTFNLHTRH